MQEIDFRREQYWDKHDQKRHKIVASSHSGTISEHFRYSIQSKTDSKTESTAENRYDYVQLIWWRG